MPISSRNIKLLLLFVFTFLDLKVFAAVPDVINPAILNAILDSTTEVVAGGAGIGSIGTAQAVINYQSTTLALQTSGSNGPGLLSAAPSQGGSAADTVSVFVSEQVPGATCWCNLDGEREGSANEACGPDIPVEKRRYECQVAKGMASFQNIIRDITKWFVYTVMLFGVLALVGAGILWAWGSDSEEYTKKAKGWAMNIIVGLAILFTFRYILGFLAPWIFQ